jgi:hypothetical protein
MGRWRVLISLAALVLTALPASAADLSKIERRILKEPVYQSKTPRYCLLAIGPEAKMQVWLVIDGEVLYVDRNGNGDLTEEGKRIAATYAGMFRVGTITEPDGKTTHTKLQVRCRSTFDQVRLNVADQRCYSAGGDATERLRFAESPKDAPIIHFDGPLTMRFYEGTPTLQVGVPNELDVMVGTPGVGKGSFAALHVCSLPQKVIPEAEVEFPAAVPGGAPQVIRCRLDDD